ncbi:hypothetical protein PG995_004597 [Apiospora arundinis]
MSATTSATAVVTTVTRTGSVGSRRRWVERGADLRPVREVGDATGLSVDPDHALGHAGQQVDGIVVELEGVGRRVAVCAEVDDPHGLGRGQVDDRDLARGLDGRVGVALAVPLGHVQQVAAPAVAHLLRLGQQVVQDVDAIGDGDVAEAAEWLRVAAHFLFFIAVVVGVGTESGDDIFLLFSSSSSELMYCWMSSIEYLGNVGSRICRMKLGCGNWGGGP